MCPFKTREENIPYATQMRQPQLSFFRQRYFQISLYFFFYFTDGYFNNEKSKSGKFQTYFSESNWIKCKITVEPEMWNNDNLEESLSLMNISNQRTLRATSCEITKESADSERPSCTCYFKDLNLKGEERLACCSDNHDPNCEQGYHFFITVLGKRLYIILLRWVLRVGEEVRRAFGSSKKRWEARLLR